MSLNDYAFNKYSQNGEDGIIEEILNRLPKSSLNYWCVEFGAWDGVHLSNTCRLIRERNYNAVLIEADIKKFRDLNNNFPSENVTKLNEWVSFEGENSLDHLLLRTSCPSDFDFLSIDIDGIDYWIFESISKFNPKIVCIEYNQTIPNVVDFINPRDFKIKYGSSAKSIVSLAVKKGYYLVAVTLTNLIFISYKFIDNFVEDIKPLDELNLLGTNPNILFSGYDGTLFSTHNSVSLGWHDIKLPIQRFQVLPRILRKYSGDYSSTDLLLYRLYMAIIFPSRIIKFFKRILRLG